MAGPGRCRGWLPVRWAGLSVLVAALVLGVVLPAGATSGGEQSLRLAQTAMQRAFLGTSRNVEATPRPAVKGKRIAIISAGQSSISAQVPTDAAVDAARAIGWTATVYDAKLVPAQYGNLVRQAVAAGVDGILLVTIDCQAVQQPLEEARAKGIAVIGIGAFDCNDPHGGGAKKGLFSARLNFGPRGKNLGALVAAYGRDEANYIVAKSNNTAKILDISDPEFTTLYYTRQGFKDTIARSHGSQIVSSLDITTADFANFSLTAKIQAELLRHPEINWIRSPYTYATTLGVVPALGANPKNIAVMGGEGFAPELDLVRAGKITAVDIFSSTWLAWAGIDTMNSVFRHEKPAVVGVGTVLADRQHNLPPSGGYEPTIGFRSEYRAAWGVH
jgi:ribose transport system substrate-binding protein